MIIDFNINCNTYDKKILNNYSFLNYECPKCNAKHSLVRHGVYIRNIVYINNGVIHEEKMNILRVKCSSCNSTHAILPNDVIPYCVYAYSYVFQILYEHFLHGDSVLSIASKYNVSFQLIYYFISKFRDFLNECIYTFIILGILRGVFDCSIKNILRIIKKYSFKYHFVNQFFCVNNWMLFMTKFHNVLPCPVYIGANNCVI